LQATEIEMQNTEKPNCSLCKTYWKIYMYERRIEQLYTHQWNCGFCISTFQFTRFSKKNY